MTSDVGEEEVLVEKTEKTKRTNTIKPFFYFGSMYADNTVYEYNGDKKIQDYDNIVNINGIKFDTEGNETSFNELSHKLAIQDEEKSKIINI